LERRRRLAVRRVLEGYTRAEVARFLEVHERTVRKWVARAEAGGEAGLAAKPHPGPAPRLTDAQVQGVLGWFRRGPGDGEGGGSGLWTAERAARRIRESFGVRYNPRYLSDWLRCHGITPQRPVRRARERDEPRVAAWLAAEWVRVAADAAVRGARVVLIDESGLLMAPLVRRGWSPRGCPPVLRHRAKWRQKVSIQAALVLPPGGTGGTGGTGVTGGAGTAGAVAGDVLLRTSMHEDSYVDGEKTAAFLRRLLREFQGELVVVWDRGNMHKGPHVRKVLEEHPRLRLEQLPPYAPDLNPVEWLWAWLKYDRLADFCPRDARHAASEAAKHLVAAANRADMLAGFFRAAGLAPPRDDGRGRRDASATGQQAPRPRRRHKTTAPAVGIEAERPLPV
jgi:transposase